MEEIERKVQSFSPPMIKDGQQTILSRYDCWALDVWILKTAMVCDLMRPEKSPTYFSPEERKQFSAVVPTEPRRLAIWLASYSGDFNSTFIGRVCKPDPVANSFIDDKVYVIALNIGKVAFKVVT